MPKPVIFQGKRVLSYKSTFHPRFEFNFEDANNQVAADYHLIPTALFKKGSNSWRIIFYFNLNLKDLFYCECLYMGYFRSSEETYFTDELEFQNNKDLGFTALLDNFSEFIVGQAEIIGLNPFFTMEKEDIKVTSSFLKYDVFNNTIKKIASSNF